MRLFYLVGYPVEHSVSPAMHNACFRALGLDCEYRLAPVDAGELAAFMGGRMRRGDVGGCNVTIPHKVGVMGHLDELDEAARVIGAVNTVVSEGGALKGYNTDYLGGVRALEEEYDDLGDAEVVILGAGGAARAMTYGLCSKARRVTVLNRDPGRAETLASRLSVESGASIGFGSLSELGDYVDSADIVVNATPVGMGPRAGETMVPVKHLRGGLLVYDLVYNPVKTRLLLEAERAGARTLGGLRMLVYQGAESFKLWTGLEPPTGLMVREALASLEAQR